MITDTKGMALIQLECWEVLALLDRALVSEPPNHEEWNEAYQEGYDEGYQDGQDEYICDCDDV
jgi:hypothetical protein